MTYVPFPALEKHHGQVVWADRFADQCRVERCLCLRCAKKPTCVTAEILSMTCSTKAVAVMVTRCPQWEDKAGR
jgi:hypothetical protein